MLVPQPQTTSFRSCEKTTVSPLGRPAGGPRAETPSSPSWLSSPRPGLLHPPSLRLLSFLRPRMLVFSEVSPFTPSLPLLLSCSLSFFSFLRSDSHFCNCSLTAGDVPEAQTPNVTVFGVRATREVND